MPTATAGTIDSDGITAEDAITAGSPVFSVASGGSPSPAEITYANATAAGVFRRRMAERATQFLPAGSVDGYGLCLRSPARKGSGYDYVLILMSERMGGGAISQVDDDVLVMRRPADAAPCLTATVSYSAIR